MAEIPTHDYAVAEGIVHNADKHVNNDDKTDAGISSPSQSAREDGSTSGEKNDTAPDPEGDSEKKYPHGLRLFFVVVALALSNFLIALDQSIVATAVPRITNHFNSIDDIGWYGSAYLLTVSCCQLLWGKFFTIFPIRTTFLVAIIVFEIGTLICGVATTSTALIIGRAIAGFGGGGVFSGVYIIVAHSVPVSRRPLYAALDSVTFGFGSVAGPLLGGVLTDKVTWRWVFWINLPLGGLAVVLVFCSIDNYRSGDDRTYSWLKTLAGLDPVGTTSIIVGVVCLLLALQWGGSEYPWSNGRVITLFVVFGVLLIAFALIQVVVPLDYSTVPSNVISQRSIAAGCVFFVGWGGAFMSVVYYLPVWFQAIKGASPLSSGIMTIPLILAYAFSSILGGIAVTKIGYYTPFMIATSIFMAVGAGLMSTFAVNSGAGDWIGYQILFGIGLGMGADLPLVAAQVVLPLNQVQTATTLLMFFQTLGATVFISVSQNVFVNRLILHLRQLLPNLDPQIVIDAGATNLKFIIDVSDTPNMLAAYNRALDETFLVPTIMASFTIIGSLLMEWKSVKEPKAEEGQKEDQAGTLPQSSA